MLRVPPVGPSQPLLPAAVMGGSPPGHSLSPVSMLFGSILCIRSMTGGLLASLWGPQAGGHLEAQGGCRCRRPGGPVSQKADLGAETQEHRDLGPAGAGGDCSQQQRSDPTLLECRQGHQPPSQEFCFESGSCWNLGAPGAQGRGKGTPPKMPTGTSHGLIRPAVLRASQLRAL